VGERLGHLFGWWGVQGGCAVDLGDMHGRMGGLVWVLMLVWVNGLCGDKGL
jgi:hypothetical protein